MFHFNSMQISPRSVQPLNHEKVFFFFFLSQENASCMSPALGSGRGGLSDSYRLKTCGVPQSTYAGATGITSYLSSVDPGGAGPQRCGVADPSRRRGVMLSPLDT